MMYALYLLIILAIVAFDQITKYLISSNFVLYEKKEIIKNFFYLKYVRNSGASFSILSGQTTFFIIVSVVATIIFVYLLLKAKPNEKLKKIALLFMMGGNFGNLIDRIRFKEVIDFISLKFFGWEFATFNVADSFMCIGVALLIIDMYLEEKHAKN